MPELPEVETIRRDLEAAVAGQRLNAIEVCEPRLLQNCTLSELQRHLQGQRLRAMERRGKFLIFNFGQRLAVVHLRMSGWFSLEPGTHTRMVMRFERQAVYFDDVRRFGTLHLVPNQGRQDHPPLRGLGLEPLGAEFTFERFGALFEFPREVKRLLLDQGKLVGVGNIYACEALHQAKVHPQTPACRIGLRKLRALHQAVKDILQRAIDAHGSTLGDAVGDYRTLDGAQGGFQDCFAVYGRAGRPCLACGTSIRRSVVAQRSTFHCPRCQRR